MYTTNSALQAPLFSPPLSSFLFIPSGIHHCIPLEIFILPCPVLIYSLLPSLLFPPPPTLTFTSPSTLTFFPHPHLKVNQSGPQPPLKLHVSPLISSLPPLTDLCRPSTDGDFLHVLLSISYYQFLIITYFSVVVCRVMCCV